VFESLLSHSPSPISLLGNHSSVIVPNGTMSTAVSILGNYALCEYYMALWLYRKIVNGNYHSYDY